MTIALCVFFILIARGKTDLITLLIIHAPSIKLKHYPHSSLIAILIAYILPITPLKWVIRLEYIIVHLIKSFLLQQKLRLWVFCMELHK